VAVVDVPPVLHHDLVLVRDRRGGRRRQRPVRGRRRGVVAIDTVIGVTLAPRQFRRIAEEKSDDAAAFVRWAFAGVPFLVAYSAVAAGAERWVISIGFVVSLAFHISAARAFRRSHARSD
jgi:hypothetical protein